MTTKKIYGPSIKWNGGECPVPPDKEVMVKLRGGAVQSGARAAVYRWGHYGNGSDIVEYRIITEQADLEAAEKLLSANGYTVTPPTKPLTFEDVEPMTEAPPEGTGYWAVHPFNEDGVALVSWTKDEFDKSVLRHRMAYLDKEHALIAARHIFGLKGGEL